MADKMTSSTFKYDKILAENAASSIRMRDYKMQSEPPNENKPVTRLSAYEKGVDINQISEDYGVSSVNAVNVSVYKLGPIGIPPTMDNNINYLRNAMTEIKITPCTLSAEMDIKFLKLDACKNSDRKKRPDSFYGNYWSDLYYWTDEYGFEIEQPEDDHLTVYAMPDSVSSDLSLTNSYSESLTEKFTNFTSDSTSQITSMLGQKGKQIWDSISKKLSSATGKEQQLKDLAGKLEAQGKGNKLNLMANLALGGRMSFPSLWSSSNSSMTLSFTVRLFGWWCDKSDDKSSLYMRNMIGPLAALVLLGTPISTDGYSFRFPYYCRVEINGLLKFDQAAVTSVSVNPQPVSERSHYYLAEYMDVNISIDLLDDSISYIRNSNYGKNPVSYDDEKSNSIQKIIHQMCQPKELKDDTYVLQKLKSVTNSDLTGYWNDNKLYNDDSYNIESGEDYYSSMLDSTNPRTQSKSEAVLSSQSNKGFKDINNIQDGVPPEVNTDAEQTAIDLFNSSAKDSNLNAVNNYTSGKFGYTYDVS